MATLIAANYQSTTVTSYGGMWISCGTLKANTLYTLKCRYKYTKNTSSHPQILCYNSTWSHTGGIYDATDDGVMKTRIITFTSYPSAINYEIGCYAWSFDNQYNGVGGKTGVLEVDWYELWEGDATEFSLTDAYAKSENKTASDFVAIGGHPSDTNTCTNSGYFSSTEPREAVRSWMGYYYKTHSSTSYGDWSYSYTDYTSAERSRSVIIYDHYSNGKIVQTGISTQVEGATLTYGDWSYNWTTTNNSTRSRTVTYTWGDNSTTSKTQTETGGTRYLVTSEEKYVGDGYGQVVHTFPANGSGSKSLTIYSHDYWNGAYIRAVTMTGVSVRCDGFICTVKDSTVTITASNLGTTPTNYKKSTIVSSKTGFETRSGYVSIAQDANNPVITTEYSVDSISPSSKSVTAAAGSFTLSWRQLKRDKFDWPSGANPTYGNWVAETGVRPSSVVSNQRWCTVGSVGTSNGSGINSTTISFGANTSTSSRSAIITVKNGGGTATCTVTQSGDKVIWTDDEYQISSISPTTKSVGAASGSFTLSYTVQKRTKSVWESGDVTYSNWTTSTATPSVTSSNTSVCTVGTPSSSSVTISYSANTSSSSTRSATITVTKGTSKTCTVTQAKQEGSWGSWAPVGSSTVTISCDTIDPIPTYEQANFSCYPSTEKRTWTTDSSKYETGSIYPSPYYWYNDGSGGSVYVKAYGSASGKLYADKWFYGDSY